MRYALVGMAALFIGVVSVLGTYSVHLQREIYRSEHILIKCNGDYLLYMGTRESAVQFSRGACPTDREIVANQDYDPSRL